MISLEHELAQIRGLDRRFLFRLNKLDIKTVKDLLWHFPHRYEDFSQVVKIGDLAVDQVATVQGQIKKIELRRTWKRRMTIVEAVIADESGSIKAIWFNQPYIARILHPEKIVNFAGRVVVSHDEIYFSNPAYEVFGPRKIEAGHTAGLIPIYPETKGLTSRGLRYLIRAVLKNLKPLEEFIPQEILAKKKLPEINKGLIKIHFPKSLDEAKQSHDRFAFENLFLLQLNNLRIHSQLAKEKAVPIIFSKLDLGEIISLIPFELTSSQKKSLLEILNDIRKPHPMNRLLQGDVGSGKTVVAAVAAFLAARNNLQAAFMAPTEVLAKQHYKTLNKIFEPLINVWELSIGLLTSSEARCSFGKNLEAPKKKTELIKQIAAGKLKIIIGTHAIIQKEVRFKNLALAIVDEQHRFGVRHRALLTGGNFKTTSAGKQKTIRNLPHFLSMSATPIPRTLSMTVFGDLDLSIIDELPKGRQPIITKIVAPANRQRAYQFVRQQIGKQKQAFVICPRIEPTNQEMTPTNPQQLLWHDIKAAKEEFEKLSTKIFPDLKIGLLHGRMKTQEKNQVMNDFSQNKVNILVSTSVVEIGVDVPNATIMVIEGADRFGLAQLYQFRGRVGRGKDQSYCLLFTDSTSAATHQRLRYLLEAKNGFELAEKDLELRGPGQFLGESQTGLPDLAMKSLNNIELIKAARDSAEEILIKDAELKLYPSLNSRLEQFQQQIHLE
jgi:ATP-dependent DNA helicase RecG